MYEQIAHSYLNEILDRLKPEVRRQDLRHFYTRLGANFYAIYTLFHHLYGRRDDFETHLLHLVEVMANHYIQRSNALEISDKAREKDHNWFLSQEWVGMALYADGFGGDLRGVEARLPYLQDLGVNLIHVMPILDCPTGKSDGGYAVSHFRKVDPRIGTLEDVRSLAESLHKRDMLLTLDVVVNHTSNEHRWAQYARAGDKKYQDYYYIFGNREIPDMFEESLPEIFPRQAPATSLGMRRWANGS